MAIVTITLDERRIRITLDTLYKKLIDLSPVMRRLGEIVHARSMQCFEDSRSPEGPPWIPSQRALRTGGKTLIKTSILRNTIHVQASRDSVSVGTPIVYGPVHQFGGHAGGHSGTARIVSAHTRKGNGDRRPETKAKSGPTGSPGEIPARPFLGLKQSDWGEIRSVLSAYLSFF